LFRTGTFNVPQESTFGPAPRATSRAAIPTSTIRCHHFFAAQPSPRQRIDDQQGDSIERHKYKSSCSQIEDGLLDFREAKFVIGGDAAARKSARPEARAVQSTPAAARAYEFANRPSWAGPNECFTDDGYGRFWPCSAGPCPR
jgi:hypothetical protein